MKTIAKTVKTSHRILLIDDDFIGIELLKEIANRFGYEYDIAANGSEALAILKANEPDYYSVVISDIVMPVMGGLELIKAVKEMPEYHHLPFIFQTARDDEAALMEGIQAGAFYYLIKPLKLDVVGKVIESAIRDLQSHNTLIDQLSSVRQALGLMNEGRFCFKTISEAQHLAAALADFSTQKNKASLGLFELMENAIEHGNLGISYDEKSQLIESQSLLSEIEQRLASPDYCNKYVTATLSNQHGEVTIEITDMGAGFNFEQYLVFSPERLTDSHGRGIMIANATCFKSMEFSHGGRTVTCTLN